MIKQFFLATLLLHCFFTKAGDTIFVKHLNLSLSNVNTGSYVTQEKGKQTILFCRNSNDTLQCFVFEKNRLVTGGLLSLAKQNGLLIASRQKYWKLFSKNGRIEKVYYADDERVVFKDDVPIEN
jgi:hypothetical protein